MRTDPLRPAKLAWHRSHRTAQLTRMARPSTALLDYSGPPTVARPATALLKLDTYGPLYGPARPAYWRDTLTYRERAAVSMTHARTAAAAVVGTIKSQQARAATAAADRAAVLVKLDKARDAVKNYEGGPDYEACEAGLVKLERAVSRLEARLTAAWRPAARVTWLDYTGPSYVLGRYKSGPAWHRKGRDRLVKLERDLAIPIMGAMVPVPAVFCSIMLRTVITLDMLTAQPTPTARPRPPLVTYHSSTTAVRYLRPAAVKHRHVARTVKRAAAAVLEPITVVDGAAAMLTAGTYQLKNGGLVTRSADGWITVSFAVGTAVQPFGRPMTSTTAAALERAIQRRRAAWSKIHGIAAAMNLTTTAPVNLTALLQEQD